MKLSASSDHLRSCKLLKACSRPASQAAKDQAKNEQNEKDEEQDLRDSHGAAGNATKSEQSGYQRNHKKYGCPVQHGKVLQTKEKSLRAVKCINMTRLTSYLASTRRAKALFHFELRCRDTNFSDTNAI
jgi:hypothetical protein